MANEGALNDLMRQAAGVVNSVLSTMNTTLTTLSTALGRIANSRTYVTGSPVTMTSADTEYSFAIPAGALEVSLSLRANSAGWRFSFTTGQVAGGAGTRIDASGRLILDGPCAGQTIYFASSTASQTMDIAYATV